MGICTKMAYITRMSEVFFIARLSTLRRNLATIVDWTAADCAKVRDAAVAESGLRFGHSPQEMGTGPLGL